MITPRRAGPLLLLIGIVVGTVEGENAARTTPEVDGYRIFVGDVVEQPVKAMEHGKDAIRRRRRLGAGRSK